MIAKNTNQQEMTKALRATSAQFQNNVIFNRFEQKGKQIAFTLKVKDSKKAGHRLHLSYGLDGLRSQRRSPHACWHVHGTFFDELFKINKNAVIMSRGKKISIDGGNWEDDNIGSMMFPVWFSESCDCK